MPRLILWHPSASSSLPRRPHRRPMAPSRRVLALQHRRPLPALAMPRQPHRRV